MSIIINSKYYLKHLVNIICKYHRNRKIDLQALTATWQDSSVVVWAVPAAAVIAST